MPYISPKMVPSTADKVIGLTDALAATSLSSGGSITPRLGVVGTDSSSSLATLSSTTSTTSTSPAPTSASTSPGSEEADAEEDTPRASCGQFNNPPPTSSEAIERYSRSVYAFTMGLYTQAQVNDHRRNKGKKSYSFTVPKRAHSSTAS